ncbi:MAG: ATP-dependent RecD-like DNA helicase [Bacillota bacterium]
MPGIFRHGRLEEGWFSMAIVEGTLERITFKNEDSCYLVARFKVRERQDVITVVGTLPGVSVGEELRLEGEWVRHKSYGWQLKVERLERLAPPSKKGIERYLGSGFIKGLGPRTAQRLVEEFGQDALRVVQEEPGRVAALKGIGPKRAQCFQQDTLERKAIEGTMVLLQEHDISPALAMRIFRKYREKAADMVREDPYRLADEVTGIGFRTADRIAQSLGIGPEAPSRLSAALLYVLSEASQEGHVYLPRESLLETAAGVTQALPEGLQAALAALEARGRVVLEPGDPNPVYLSASYRAETGVASALKRLREARATSLEGWAEDIVHVQSQLDLDLHESQVRALGAVAGANVTVLTGGPGTGKTTVLRALVALLARRRMPVALAAPTGRAAKRLSEVTGEGAKTIHRLLEYRVSPVEGGRFLRNEESRLEAEAVIVDEASMVDVLLAHSLVKAIRPGARLVLVGDADQLPSVGAGNFLRDVMASGAFPVIALSHIFRQASESMIVMNAHRVNAGEFPRLNAPGKDFFFVEEDDPDALGDVIVDLCARRVPAFGKWHPVRDVQVLAPMRRGAAGVEELNRRLQERLNPAARGKPEMRLGASILRLGDKVMQVCNNYEKDVFNGDSGVVAAIDTGQGRVTVAYPDRRVTYDRAEIDELVVSYAISVHKSQGSEYPVVIVPVTTQHYMMLQRNLLYTALTRARSLVVLAGTKKALAIAVRNNRVEERNTLLRERLQGPETPTRTKPV